MEDSLHHHPPLHPREVALDVVRTLRGKGHRAFFAGGCVRDELLGREPADYDVATDATPDRISSLFRRTSQVGASFGVVLVKYGPSRDAGTIEVATFRSDGQYTDKRRPDRVSFSDPQADAQRRDFTCNALFMDPILGPDDPEHASLPRPCSITPAPRGGAIIDFVGGRADLDAKVLRAVGDPEKRLAEDHLRALRAVRLATRLSFALDAATASAISVHAGDLAGVSRERIGDEIRAMMSHSARARAISLLTKLGLDAATLEEKSSASTAHPVLESLPAESSFATTLAAWALDRGIGSAESLRIHAADVWQGMPSQRLADLCTRWRRALCLSNDEREGLECTLRWWSLLQVDWDGLTEARRRRTAASRWRGPAMALMTRHPDITIRTLSEQRELEIRALETSAPGLSPEPLVGGDDLIRAGFAAGPRFRRLLEALYDAQLERRILTPADGLELARSLSV